MFAPLSSEMAGSNNQLTVDLFTRAVMNQAATAEIPPRAGKALKAALPLVFEAVKRQGKAPRPH